MMNKHKAIVRQLTQEAETDPNVSGLLLFGSVASDTHRQDSDIDTITLFTTHEPEWGMKNTDRGGIKVGDVFFTVDILVHSVETVPYLLYPFADAKLLVDREGLIQPIQNEIRAYFAGRPDVEAEWQGFYEQLRREKAEFGYEKTTIVDVWNELEKHHSASGRTRRRFFNAFYLTSPRIFGVLKRFL